MGDIELRFHDGRSIKAHGLKLKLSALDGVLCNLIDDVLDDQITHAAAKRKRVDPAGAAVDLPVLKVSAMRPHAGVLVQQVDRQHYSCMHTYLPFWTCSQLDGEYEDWMEVLRLIYYSGRCVHIYWLLLHNNLSQQLFP